MQFAIAYLTTSLLSTLPYICQVSVKKSFYRHYFFKNCASIYRFCIQLASSMFTVYDGDDDDGSDK